MLNQRSTKGEIRRVGDLIDGSAEIFSAEAEVEAFGSSGINDAVDGQASGFLPSAAGIKVEVRKSNSNLITLSPT